MPHLELQNGFAIFIGHYFADVLIHADDLAFFYQNHGEVRIYREEIAMVEENGLTLAGNIEDGAYSAFKYSTGEGSAGRCDINAIVHGGDSFKIGMFVYAERLGNKSTFYGPGEIASVF
ncbi:MAG: hypothetical protein RLZZ47_1613 [Bacteroidota bacterium]